MGGASAGAVTSLLRRLALRGSRARSGNPGYPSAIRAAVSMSGGAPTNEAIDANDPPAIFFHGDQDRTVRRSSGRSATPTAMYDGTRSSPCVQVARGRRARPGVDQRRSRSSPTTSSTTRSDLAERRGAEPRRPRATGPYDPRRAASRSPASPGCRPSSPTTGGSSSALAERGVEAAVRRLGRSGTADWSAFADRSSSARPGTTRGAATSSSRWCDAVGDRARTTAPALVRWNSDKRYLGDLADAGRAGRSRPLRRRPASRCRSSRARWW